MHEIWETIKWKNNYMNEDIWWVYDCAVRQNWRWSVFLLLFLSTKEQKEGLHKILMALLVYSQLHF